VYEADVLPRVNSAAWFEQAFNHLNYKVHLIEAAYRAYKMEVEMLELAITNNLDFITIDHALKQFPKIESVELMILGGGSEVWEKSSQSTTILTY